MYSNPRSGQILTPALSQITREVAVMDSCYAPFEAHQYGIANRSLNGQTRIS